MVIVEITGDVNKYVIETASVDGSEPASTAPEHDVVKRATAIQKAFPLTPMMV